MADITLRFMEPEDYSTFLDFYRDLHDFHAQARPDRFRREISLPPKDVFEADLQRDDRDLFFALCDGKPAGMCIMVWKSPPDDPAYPLILPRLSAHIDDLYVAPAFRRRGIATFLLQKAEEMAKERHADNLTLQVWAFNGSAMALYRKLGLEPLMLYMEKRL